MSFDLAESFVLAAEEALGARLPDSYRIAMQRSNGGEIEAVDEDWQLFPLADNSDRKRLSRSANHVLRETAHSRGWSGFPANGLAIAGNGSGDLLMFLEKGGVIGPAVYVWSHETRELTLVAPDFTELA